MCLQKLCLLQAQNLIWQKIEAAAVPQLCLHLHPTVELKLLFFHVRSSASACGISRDNSNTWQGITLLSHLTASAAMHCFFSGRGPTVENQSTRFRAIMSAVTKRWRLD
uniref:PPUP9090 n=1 Tax=Poeciliopsis prolifica TaxID=188132 RepID=A0A0S7EJF9_9TELE